MQSLKFVFGVTATLLVAAACSPAAEAPEKAVPVTVPAAYVGTWDSDGCDPPSVRIGMNDIRHFYADAASPLTSAQATPDGRLVVTWMDEGQTTTDTFQLTDGKLDHISTVSASSTDQWESAPMSLCPGPSPLDG